MRTKPQQRFLKNNGRPCQLAARCFYARLLLRIVCGARSNSSFGPWRATPYMEKSHFDWTNLWGAGQTCSALTHEQQNPKPLMTGATVCAFTPAFATALPPVGVCGAGRCRSQTRAGGVRGRAGVRTTGRSRSAHPSLGLTRIWGYPMLGREENDRSSIPPDEIYQRQSPPAM